MKLYESKHDYAKKLRIWSNHPKDDALGDGDGDGDGDAGFNVSGLPCC